MLRQTNDEDVLTRFEKSLDSHHRTLPLWSQPRPEAIFATLAAFDLLMLPLAVPLLAKGPSPHAVQKIKGYHDSLIYAMRFFWEETKTLDVRPTNDQSVIEQALEYLLHCATYATLTDMHTGYGRGLYTLNVDETQKLIRFVYGRKNGSTPDPVGILEDTPQEWHNLCRAIEQPSHRQQLIEQVNAIPHHWENGVLMIDDLHALRQPIFDEALEQVLPQHEPNLDDAADLAGFTAMEMRAIWHALFKWSMVAMGIYAEATVSGKHQHEHLPTQLITRNRLIHGIADLSGIRESTVTAFLDRISFGSGCAQKADIFLQPVVCAGDFVAWSPHLIQLCKYKRNMLKLMARIPALKPVSDNLIGSQARESALQFGRYLAAHGYQFKTGILLPDQSGEIDLLAYHTKHPTQLLVVEAKTVLGPDEVNEVDQVTKVLIDGQEQLRNILSFLNKADSATKNRMWPKIPWNLIDSWHGIILTPNAQPNSRYDHRKLPAITLETIKRYFYDSDLRSPLKVWKTSIDKRWLKKFAPRETTYSALQVGDITYEIPVLHF